MWCVDRKIEGPTAFPRDAKTVIPRDGFFYPHQTTMIDSFSCKFFFLHAFWSPAFDFNVGVASNESRSCMLTSTILKFDVAMTSTPNVLMTQLCDTLYNQCIDNTWCYSIFIYPTSRIRVCKISFVSTGKNHGNPCLARRYPSATQLCPSSYCNYPKPYMYLLQLLSLTYKIAYWQTVAYHQHILLPL